MQALTRLSTLALAADDYEPHQLEAALRGILAVDPQLVADGTYALIEQAGQLLACGGWSRRVTRFGDDGMPQPGTRELDPLKESAGLRALFVHPDHARQGLASRLLAHCEAQARQAGFRQMEAGATLPGVRLYRHHGYSGALALEHQMPGGATMRIVPMHKDL